MSLIRNEAKNDPVIERDDTMTKRVKAPVCFENIDLG